MDDGVWVGIDAGKEFHWASVMDGAGTELLSRRVQNDEADLLELIEEVLSLAGRNRLVWAIDQPGGGGALTFWRCCGSVSTESSTSPAWPWSGRATPIAGSPRLTPKTLASSPIRPG
jgi:Transposase